MRNNFDWIEQSSDPQHQRELFLISERSRLPDRRNADNPIRTSGRSEEFQYDAFSSNTSGGSLNVNAQIFEPGRTRQMNPHYPTIAEPYGYNSMNDNNLRTQLLQSQGPHASENDLNMLATELFRAIHDTGVQNNQVAVLNSEGISAIHKELPSQLYPTFDNDNLKYTSIGNILSSSGMGAPRQWSTGSTIGLKEPRQLNINYSSPLSTHVQTYPNIGDPTLKNNYLWFDYNQSNNPPESIHEISKSVYPQNAQPSYSTINNMQKEQTHIYKRCETPLNDFLDLNSSVTQRRPSCKFCHKNGEPFVVFASHAAKTSAGIVTCPVLRRHICELCGATGDKAHTRRYCPLNNAETKELPTFRRLANGMLTANHNHK